MAFLLLITLLHLLVWSSSTYLFLPGHCLGSMSSVAASYGSNGEAFCGLRVDVSHSVDCFGSDAPTVYGAPHRLPLLGLTAGDGFVCGLTQATRQPYCWGNNIYVEQGVPTPRAPNLTYTQISAGDNHLCALRSKSTALQDSVDCWGYNMTSSFVQAPLLSITAGSLFTCGLFAENYTVTCWGDETGSRVISKIPHLAQFESVSAGGYHVCGILRKSRYTVCWGSISSPNLGDSSTVFSSVVGGKFQACGLFAANHTPYCWGVINLPNKTPAPVDSQFLGLVAGDYYTCGVAMGSLQPYCWGSQYSAALPLAVSPGVCSSMPCAQEKYAMPVTDQVLPCDRGQAVCVPCTQGCPAGMAETSPCSSNNDRQCAVSVKENSATSPIQTLAIIGELAIAVLVIGVILLTAYLWVKYKLAKKLPDNKIVEKETGKPPSLHQEKVQRQAVVEEEPKTRRAEIFSLQEMEQATGGFGKESEIGRGSYACVYKGLLSDGRTVAVKRASIEPAKAQSQKDSREFRNELDLLSRLNHAHLLSLLGFCEDGGERLLVYEFMANGTLHEQLHSEGNSTLGWIRRVTIAVQAARALEYLHGYAYPPVIHRDIKSSNILLDGEWNARVSDFGLSLLGPQDSNSPLSELPAGTLGYLDPEYYRLHYLTTKSDIYSFGVLLLEILSSRKAIDMQYEECNIVEWAVPLIKAADITPLLDPRLEPPSNKEAITQIAKIACRCVKMRGKDRPGMDKVTTVLERALAILLGTPSDEQPILPSEVVLGSSRLHHKSAQKSCSELESSSSTERYRHSSSITFPSLHSSQRIQSSVSDEEDGMKKSHNKEEGMELQKLEIIPASHINTNTNTNINYS